MTTPPPFDPATDQQADQTACPHTGTPAFPVVEVAPAGQAEVRTFKGVHVTAHPHPYAAARPHPAVSPYAPVRTSTYPRVYK